MKKIFIIISMVISMIFPVISSNIVNAGEVYRIDVGTDYSDLPSADEKIRVSSILLYDESTNSHQVEFNYWNDGDIEVFTFYIAIPTVLNLDDYYVNDEWNVFYDEVMYKEEPDDIYTLTDNVLIFQVDGSESDFVINLDNMEYEEVRKLDMNSITYKGENSNAYMYCFYDFRIEDILEIDVNFKYRYITAGFIPEQWLDEELNYKKGQWVLNSFNNVETVWLQNINWFNFTNPIDTSAYFSFTEAVTDIEIDDIPDSVMEGYEVHLNGTEEDLSNQNLYKIYLGHYQKTLSTGYDIQELIVQRIKYVYRGVIYEAYEPDTNQDNVVPDPVPIFPGWDGILPTIPDWSDSFESIINTIKLIITVVVVLVVLYLIIKVFNYFKYMKLFSDVRSLKNASNKSKVTKSNRR